MLKLIDYSEKAFAVVGDSKPFKDGLKNIGGRWNPRLKCGSGWIFSKKHLVAVAQLLNVPETLEPLVIPEANGGNPTLEKAMAYEWGQN